MKKFAALLLVFTIIFSNTVLAYDPPSDWALNDVNEARTLGIVPDFLMGGYNYSIIRQEFCSLCANTLRAWGITEKGNISVKFSDLTGDNDVDPDILFCASHGIVSGTGGGKFEPTRYITRQEAAKMLCSAYRVLLESKKEHMPPELSHPHVFKDGYKIASWAREDIYTAYHTGVMQGDTNGSFDPEGSYTREQAICTFLRLYKLKDEPKIIREYYMVGECEKYLSSYNGECSLDMYSLKEYTEYAPEYIDEYFGHYTADELGYVYPIGSDYMTAVTSVGAGVGSNIIINKNMDNVLSGAALFTEVDEIEGDRAFVHNNFGREVYDLKTGQKADTAGSDYVFGIGGGVYAASYNKDGEDRYAYLNNKLERITDIKYIRADTTVLNNMFAAVTPDGTVDVLTTEGNILTSTKIDLNTYWVYNIYGTNLILQNKKTLKDDIFRAGSREYIKGFDRAEFMPGGEINVYSGGKGSILDINGRLKFTFEQKGYSDIMSGIGVKYDGFYFGSADKDGGAPYDVLDRDGNPLVKGITDRFLESDGGGMFCGQRGDYELVVFDSHGKEYADIKTGHAIEDCCFINGLLRVTSNNGINTYYFPNGEDAAFLNGKIQN